MIGLITTAPRSAASVNMAADQPDHSSSSLK
jgi:hypothetical protein